MVRRPMARRSIAVSLAIIACALGAAAAVVVVRSRSQEPVTPRDASADFVAAWERSKNGTYVIESTFERRTKDGGRLTSTREVVQRPPDHLIRQFGGVTGAFEGKLIVCVSDPSKPSSCTATGPPAPAYGEEVAKEIENLRSYFNRKPPIYAATGGEDGCYHLESVGPAVEYPYGSKADFCFDGRTGALTRVVRHLENDMVEEMQATSIRTEVVRADFDLTPDPGSEPVVTPGTGRVKPEGTEPEPGSKQRRPHSGLEEAALFEAMAKAEVGPESNELADEAFERLKEGRLSINDPRWRDSTGDPIVIVYQVIRRMLEAGYYLPGP